LEAAAKKIGIPAEKVLEQEVDAKVAEPSEAELKALYIVQKQQLGRPFDELRPQLQQLLKKSKIQEAREDYYKTASRASRSLHSPAKAESRGRFMTRPAPGRSQGPGRHRGVL